MHDLNIGKNEKEIQNRVISLFRDQLKYEYLGNWEYRSDNSDIEESELRKYLLKKVRSCLKSCQYLTPDATNLIRAKF